MKLLKSIALLLLGAASAYAFPPAPPHLVFGTLRNDLGQPIGTNVNARIVFETTAGTVLKGEIGRFDEPGVNYQVSVPMDSGLTGEAYKPSALHPSVPFRIHVNIGGVNYYPIEMNNSAFQLGLPADSTRIDLTLGVDSDGDGLPDAWERQLLSALGKDGLGLVNANDDSDGDGLSNLAEYIAGAYAFDPTDGFSLSITGFADGSPVLEFLALRNRTYQLYGSTDFASWSLLRFRLQTDPTDSSRGSYTSPDVANRKIIVESDTPAAPKFFKLLVR